jgi:hypothetical protein
VSDEHTAKKAKGDDVAASSSAAAATATPALDAATSVRRETERETERWQGIGLTRRRVQAKVKKQVEFYFSDNNFVRDKFLRAETAKNKEGVRCGQREREREREREIFGRVDSKSGSHHF